MNKKALILAVALLGAGMAQAFALGIGAQTGGMYRGGGTPRDGFSGNAAFTLKGDDAPWAAAAEFLLQKNGFELGLTADLWLGEERIEEPFYWFWGFGLSGSVRLGDDQALYGGIRVPVGVYASLAERFIEPYLQIAPGAGIRIDDGARLFWSVPVNLGVRFWPGKYRFYR
ncbi:hypothetical protein [Treponema endosymbiont of Eucomonympha sp.]|uniref:hypothetical protein n=1 Tax=Treponema endosymbiont of Eucomonympha sp. TaxID=1580831 RepID=UPI0007507B60|nr:hypothetical protein [Treponema endosymbiont of Eucomonympha sp.]